MSLFADTSWHVARSTGWVAWVLLGCTVVWGALATGRLLAGRGMPRWLMELHRHLSRLTLMLLAVHLGALLVDDFVHFDVVDVLVPGAAAWKPGAVAWGVLALWLVVLVQLSSWPALRVPRSWWRVLHLLSYPAWCLAAVHAVQAGTDASTALGRALIAAMTTAVSFVVLGRILQLGRRSTRKVPVMAQELTGQPVRSTRCPDAAPSPPPSPCPSPASSSPVASPASARPSAMSPSPPAR